LVELTFARNRQANVLRNSWVSFYRHLASSTERPASLALQKLSVESSAPCRRFAFIYKKTDTKKFIYDLVSTISAIYRHSFLLQNYKSVRRLAALWTKTLSSAIKFIEKVPRSISLFGCV